MLTESIRCELQGKTSSGRDVNVTFESSRSNSFAKVTYAERDFETAIEDTALRIVMHEIGALVTFTIRQSLDLGWTTVTLVLPRTAVPSGSDHLAIRTFCIKVVNLFGPSLQFLDEIRSQYELTELTGKMFRLSPELPIGG